MVSLTSTDSRSRADAPVSAHRRRPVTHALAAFGCGVLASLGIPFAGVLTGLGATGVVLAVVLLIAASGAVFGLLGEGFRGRDGWWLAFTALPWTAAVIGFWLLGLSTSTGWGFALTVGLGVGAVGAGCALLPWGAGARMVGIVLLGIVAATAVTWFVVLATIDQPSAARYDGEVPSFATTVPGYTAGETSGPVRHPATVYRSGDHSFVLSVEPLDTDPCGAALTSPAVPSEAETTCTASAERWYRTSASLQEVAVVRGGWIVRASSTQTVSLGDLENAIALAVPEGAQWTTDEP